MTQFLRWITRAMSFQLVKKKCISKKDFCKGSGLFVFNA